MRAVEAVGGGGMSDVIRLVDDENANQKLISVGYVDCASIPFPFRSNYPHYCRQQVTALSLAMTASQLLVGTSSGQIHIYDVESRQLLRSIDVYKDKGLAVASLTTLLKPPDLFGHVSFGDGGASTRDADPVRPVAPFQKIRNASAREKHEVAVMLPIQSSV